ncbi:ATP/GTP-binding protein [Belnapia sp. F-4-1]|uniref:AAA family ATPase n=1 Tax=Belnapia sp. F-4-1 TaxID=1545443 RepID=UPI0009DEE82D|nr:ATP-binding protein [Belnapia sp. F-4-1]
MLLRFGAANHGSINEYAELSLIASEAIKDSGPMLFEPEGLKERVLPVVLIYGANASGKTTVYTSLSTMRRHVLDSFTRTGPADPVFRRPFALDPAAAKQPTRFDCDFLLDGIRYHFGFEATDQEYTREWMYYFPGGNRRSLYYRDVQNPHIDFGKSLKGRNRAIEEFTRKNSLFLSAAAQNAHPQLTQVFSYFSEKIQTVSAAINLTSIKKKLGQGIDSRILQFLTRADTGIIAADVQKTSPSASQLELYKKIVTVINSQLGENVSSEPPQEEVKISFGHAGITGDPVYLDFETESRGTVRLLDLLRGALAVIDNGGVLIIDELDVSLHTLLALELVEMFSKTSTNKGQAQLIATTHDTNVLCSQSIRRDQIWFCEKSNVGATHFYPLTKIRTRNTDNLEKGYLQGRYGAIPYLGSVEALLGLEQ